MVTEGFMMVIMMVSDEGMTIMVKLMMMEDDIEGSVTTMPL